MAIKGLLVQPKTAWKIRIEPASTSTMTTQGLVFGQKSSAPPSEESSPCPHGLHVILCSKTSVCSMSMSLRCPPSTSSHGAPRPCNPPCNGRSRRPERPGKKHARARSERGGQEGTKQFLLFLHAFPSTGCSTYPIAHRIWWFLQGSTSTKDESSDPDLQLHLLREICDVLGQPSDFILGTTAGGLQERGLLPWNVAQLKSTRHPYDYDCMFKGLLLEQ